MTQVWSLTRFGAHASVAYWRYLYLDFCATCACCQPGNGGMRVTVRERLCWWNNDGASALLLITCHLSPTQPARVPVRSLSCVLFLHRLCVCTSLLDSDIKQTLIHLFSPQHLTPRFIFLHLMSDATDRQQFFGYFCVKLTGQIKRKKVKPTSGKADGRRQ